MIDAKAKVDFNARAMLDKAKSASFESLSQAAGALRLIAIRSIKRDKKPSPPGTPVHTRKGQIKRAILYFVDRATSTAIIGPSAEIIGKSGAAHEFGGKYKRETFKKRPFMGPALEKLQPKLSSFWSGSIKQ